MITKEQFNKEFQTATSIADLLRKLGLRNTGYHYRWIHKVASKYGFDLSALKARRNSLKLALSKSSKDFSTLIEESHSFQEILRKLKVSPSGTAYATMRGMVAEMQLDTTHFRGQGWSAGSNKWTNQNLALIVKRNSTPDEEIFIENYTGGVNNKLLFERLMQGKYKTYTCERCPINHKHNEKAIRLELHHRNGVSNDNRIENLEILCPNCHSQAEIDSIERGTERLQKWVEDIVNYCGAENMVDP